MGSGQAVAYDYDAQDSYDAAYWQQEAIKAVEQAKGQLETEMQARLDQVHAQVEALESLNRREVTRLHLRAFSMLLLAVAIAGVAGWLFVKKVIPRVNLLQSTISAQQVELDRVVSQLREQIDKAHSMEERYVAAREELDRLKKANEPARAVPATDLPKAKRVPARVAPRM